VRQPGSSVRTAITFAVIRDVGSVLEWRGGRRQRSIVFSLGRGRYTGKSGEGGIS